MVDGSWLMAYVVTFKYGRLDESMRLRARNLCQLYTHMLLEKIIISKIKEGGPVSFHDCMETALYYPGEGHYSSEGCKFGIECDFYTSPYLCELFGQMLAIQIEEI